MVIEIEGKRVLECAAEGPVLRTGRDATDLIGEARSVDSNIVVVPIARLDPVFFDLRTGVAGEMLQKFVNYQVAVAIIGDTVELTSKSKALHDFIYESNRRGSTWFLANKKELEARLASILPAQ